MGIAMTQTIDCDGTPGFDSWVKAPTGDFVAPDPDPIPGFEFLLRKEMGVGNFEYAWPVRRNWAIYYTPGGTGPRQPFAILDTTIFLRRRMVLRTVGYLQVDSKLDKNVKDDIRLRMDSYDPASGIDPLDWANEIIPEGVNGFGAFDQALTWTASDLKLTTVTDSEDAQLATWRADEEYEVQLLSETPLSTWEPPPPQNEQAVQAKQDLEDPTIATNHAVSIAAPMHTGCETTNVFTDRIADVFWYPEFKVAWRLRTITIGCIEIKLHVPVLYTRGSTVTLWAYGAHSDDSTGVLLNVLGKCIGTGASSPLVVGLAFFNFPAALLLFNALFLRCIVDSVGNTIECVSAGLSLLTIRTPWAAVW